MAGCAAEQRQGGYEFRPALVDPQPPSAKDPRAETAPATKPRVKVASPAPATPAAKPPGGATAEPQDEASCRQVERCAGVLKAMVAHADRSWIGRPATPAALANGVRLFAYRTLRTKLTCEELALAHTEVDRAVKIFAAAVPGLELAQVTRARTLSIQVRAELHSESALRCPHAGKDGTLG